MAITPILSTFASEQSVKGSEDRAVKRGTTGNIFNYKFSVDETMLTIDFTDVFHNGIRNNGVDATFAGTQNYLLSFTGFVYIQTIIQDGLLSGDAYSIVSTIEQGVSIPADVENDITGVYEYHTELFKTGGGSLINFQQTLLNNGKINGGDLNSLGLIDADFLGLNWDESCYLIVETFNNLYSEGFILQTVNTEGIYGNIKTALDEDTRFFSGTSYKLTFTIEGANAAYTNEVSVLSGNTTNKIVFTLDNFGTFPPVTEGDYTKVTSIPPEIKNDTLDLAVGETVIFNEFIGSGPKHLGYGWILATDTQNNHFVGTIDTVSQISFDLKSSHVTDSNNEENYLYNILYNDTNGSFELSRALGYGVSSTTHELSELLPHKISALKFRGTRI